jgi:hypothetical protein
MHRLRGMDGSRKRTPETPGCRAHQAFLIAVGFLATAAWATAQAVSPAPSAQAADTANTILAEKPAAAPALDSGPKPDSRPAPGSVAANIAAGLPAYAPVKSGAGPGDAAADLRDIDKPRNQIPRLPVQMMQRYVVRESRVPVFRPRDLYTKEGLIERSFKEHPGLRIGNFFNLNAKAAYEAIVNEQLFADRQELTDIAIAMAVGGDAEEAEAMQQAIIEKSFMSGTKEGPIQMK